jgi:hypothetical protein
MLAGTLSLGAIRVPLSDVLGREIPALSTLSVGISLAALAAGAGLIFARFRPGERVRGAAERQYATNAALRTAIVNPTLALSALVARADAAVDGIVDAIGRGVLGLARGNDRVERRGIDAAVDGLARAVERGGSELPRLQSGQLYLYLRNTVAGMALVATLFAVVAII